MIVRSGFGWTAAATSFGLACLSGTSAIAYTDPDRAAYRSGYPTYYSPNPYSDERRPTVVRPQASRQRTIEAKNAPPKPEPPKPPAGPLTISVSIGSQHVTIFDEATPIGTAPISTGMPGHPTPMGVFSVIQKDRYHHSNLYSNAPMPYMQRITWSGVALHAGVLPGYPASHGCIRLPESFAVRLWNMTQLGVRVVVTRNEVAPHEISHPLLAALTTPRPEPAPPAAAPDATAAPAKASAKEDEKKSSDTKRPEMKAADTKPADAQQADAKPVDTKQPDGTDTPAIELAKADPPAEATGEPAPVTSGVNPGSDPDLTASSAPSASPTSTPSGELSAPVLPPVSTASTAASAASAATAPPAPPARVEQVAAAAPVENSDEPRPVIGGFGPTEQIPVPGIKPAKVLPNPGPISIFVSRKSGKLYVRKGFEPMFEMPVTIVNKDLPLGTHVFTAGQPAPGGGLHWTAMSIATTQAAEPVKSKSRGGREAKPVFVPEPAAPAAAEALNRIEFPPEVLNGIAPYMTPGASILISDLGMSGETTKATDFIVVTR